MFPCRTPQNFALSLKFRVEISVRILIALGCFGSGTNIAGVTESLASPESASRCFSLPKVAQSTRKVMIYSSIKVHSSGVADTVN